MEVKVVIENILEKQTFSFKKVPNKEYVKYSFVGKTNGQYPKKIKFDVNGEDLFKKMDIAVGNEYSVLFNIESREWNGKWFTEIQAWKAVKLNQQNQQSQLNQPKQEPVQDNDYPF